MKTGGEERQCCSRRSVANCSTWDKSLPPPHHQVLNPTCDQSAASSAGFTWLVTSLSPVSRQVTARPLGALCGFLRERRPLLVSLNVRPPQDLNRLPYATLRSLRVNTLVHALLRVTHTHLSTGEWHTGVR